MDIDIKIGNRRLAITTGKKAEADAPWTPSKVGFGPSEPLRPASAEEPIRREDYMVGRNVLFTPRAAEPRSITYSQMRNLADAYDILRSVIEKRKDELKGLEWDIGPALGHETEDVKKAVAEMRDFWQSPDGDASFDQWLGVLSEDLFVIDALSLYINKDKKGKVKSLDTIDGSTIWMLVDDRGRIPNPPEPAYEQNIKNFPRTWWTKDELIYRPYNLRSMGLYGFSHVESIILTVNIAFRREVQFLEWFRSSNLPAALIQAPETWTPQQIVEWQTNFDNLLAGNLAARSRVNLVPGGGGPPAIFQPLTFDAKFDEWMARVVCARFGVSPTPYVAQVNRAQAQTMEESSKEESLVPIMQHLKGLFDFIIQKHMGHPELQFVWTEVQHYKLQDAQLDDLLVKSGMTTIDDVRRSRGQEPYAGGLGAKPMIWTQAGPMLLEDVVNRKLTAKPLAPGETGEPGVRPGDEKHPIDKTPQDDVEDDKEPAENETAEEVKAELKDWEKFAINRLGKKSTRKFETKVIPHFYADKLEAKVQACATPQAIKALFGTEAAKVAYWEGFVRDTESFEPKAITNLKNMFRAQFKEVIQNLKNAKDANVKLFDRDKAIRDYTQAMAGISKSAITNAVRQAAALMKPANPHTATKQGAFEAVNEAAMRWLTTRIKWAAEQISDETEKLLRDQLLTGFGEGESIPQLAERVQDTFAEFDSVRSERIARTEVIAASSQGAVESYKDAGLTQSEWYPAMDERECALCESLAGVHDLAEKYTPPAHPNCRCVLLPVLD